MDGTWTGGGACQPPPGREGGKRSVVWDPEANIQRQPDGHKITMLVDRAPLDCCAMPGRAYLVVLGSGRHCCVVAPRAFTVLGTGDTRGPPC